MLHDLCPGTFSSIPRYSIPFPLQVVALVAVNNYEFDHTELG